MRKVKNYIKAQWIVVLVSMWLGMSTYALGQYVAENYQFQSPIVFQSPVIKKIHSPIPLDYNITLDKEEIEKYKKRPTSTIAPSPTSTPTPTLAPVKKSQASDQEIMQMIVSYDWDDSIAVRVAKSENFWNLTKSFDCARTNVNKNGSVDYGIFQINSIHEQRLKKLGMTMEDMKDCKKNIAYAYEWLYSYQGWTPWVSYTNGSYLSHSDKID